MKAVKQSTRKKQEQQTSMNNTEKKLCKKTQTAAKERYKSSHLETLE